MPEYEFSVWERHSFLGYRDVCILGAGIVGMSTALSLRERFPTLRIAVLERGFLPMGASTRNAGFACFGSVSELLDDLESMSEDVVAETVRMRWQGLSKLKERLGEKNIRYQEGGGIEVFYTREELERCTAQIPDLNQKMEEWIGEKQIYAVDAGHCEQVGFNNLFGSIHNRAEGVLHPGEMMRLLTERCREASIDLFFGLEVQRWHEHEAGVDIECMGGLLRCKKFLLATNGFTNNLLSTEDLKPARNIVLLTTALQNPLPGGIGYHLDSGYIYWRMVGTQLLIGGARNLDPEQESTTQFGYNDAIVHFLSELLQKRILSGQSFTIEQQWSGIMGVGGQKKPIIRMNTEHVGLAVRMGGMGVAIGSLVGDRAAEMLAVQLESNN